MEALATNGGSGGPDYGKWEPNPPCTELRCARPVGVPILDPRANEAVSYFGQVYSHFVDGYDLFSPRSVAQAARLRYEY